VEMGLDIARDDASQRTDEIVHLSRGSAADRVRNSLDGWCESSIPSFESCEVKPYHTVHANLIDGTVDAQ
jgi:hypothetical protein